MHNKLASMTSIKYSELRTLLVKSKPDVVKEMGYLPEISTAADLDTVDGIKTLLESSNVPLICDSLRKYIVQYSTKEKK